MNTNTSNQSSSNSPTFEQLNLIAPILKAIQEEGYERPTPIQAQSIPIILDGNDLLGCAQTGTGKTAAFAIPILQLLTEIPGPRKIRTLILTPTRELAIQIDDSFKAYGRYTRLKSTVIFGGVGQAAQVEALKRNPEILIATPGRLLDLIGQGFINLKDLEFFVLDEADRMLDMGFIHDVRKVLKVIPAKRQSLFFSATMPKEIVALSNSILRNPKSVAVTPVSSTAEIISQEVYFVEKSDKNALLLKVLENPAIEQMLVFTRTKHGADKVVRTLEKHKIKAEAIHGNKSQNARQRALTNFKTRESRILVATDIAARGIDVDELAWVLNYELPNVPETYVHRIGRTGRAGSSGTAISFCDTEERAYLKDIEKLIKQKIPVAGEIAPSANPEPEPERGPRPQRNQPKPRQNRAEKPKQQASTTRSNESRPTASNEATKPKRKKRYYGRG